MYRSRIYLEARILLDSPQKAFCPCKAAVGASCPVCSTPCGQPFGGSPQLSDFAARKAALLAAALEAQVRERMDWERFAAPPPLPPDYQLSGLSLLAASGGRLPLSLRRGRRDIGIAEIRVEEYPGRLVREGGAARMDYSSSGRPCLRLRTEADFELGEEAEAFIVDLRSLIQYLDLAPGPLDSTLRCNAFVSLAPTGSPEAERRWVKLRNLNSLNFLRKAIDAELSRQEEILAQGGEIPHESRLWNEAEGRTERFKERTDDSSRYAAAGFPPLPAPPCFGSAKRGLPAETPSRMRERLTRDLGIPWQHARAATADLERSSFFEAVVAAGAEPALAARWMAGELQRLARREEAPRLADCGLTPERFARILSLFSQRRIHARMARRLMEAVWDGEGEPEELIEAHQWSLISDPAVLAPLVEAVLAERKEEISRIRAGEGAQHDFIIGRVMEGTSGQADPAILRKILRERLSSPTLQLLCIGGAIVSSTEASGDARLLDKKRILSLLSADLGNLSLSVEAVPGAAAASEDIGPADWAALLALMARKVWDEGARGVVVAHGTDTLAWTAALVWWLFADSPVPIVLAASSTGPEDGEEAARTLNQACALAAAFEPGVYVVAGGRVLSPLNLRFERIGPEGFRNWNLAEPLHRGQPLAEGIQEVDEDILAAVMEEIVRKTCILRVYPGMRSETVRAVMDTGIRYLILELYDTGTANLRGRDFSLREALSYARKRGITIFCTSQQEGGVDFTRYASSRGLILSGAVSMGGLTTESAYARLLAAYLEAEGHEELLELMDT